jgi:hypothetical protein
VILNAVSNSGQTYQWLQNGTPVTAATTAAYTASTTGSYRVAIAITATGCKDTSSNAVVTVNPLPAANIVAAGSTTACQGDTVWLNANTGSGLSYQWKLNGIAVTGATSASYPAVASGSYSVAVTNGSNCSTTSGSLNVTINPRPGANITYTTPVTFCKGGAVVLTAVSGTGVTYQWYNNGVALTGSTGNFFIADTTGNFSVAITNTLGCSAQSPTILVVVNPVPEPVITLNNSLLSTGSYSGYQWYLNGTLIPGATTQTYAATQNGGYSVRVTDANGCTAYSVNVFVNNLGIAPSPDTSIKIYPNPAQDVVTIAAPVSVNVSLQDVTGRTIMHRNGVKEIAIGELADGAYLLIVRDGAGQLLKTEKLLKSTR